MYVEVYLPISIEKSFSYLVPQNLKKEIQEGHLVYVPFGQRIELGYVDKINKKILYKGKVKSIHNIASSIIISNPDIKNTIDWMERYYLTSKGALIKNIFSYLFNKNFYINNNNKIISITSKGKQKFDSKNINGDIRYKIIQYLPANFVKVPMMRVNHIAILCITSVQIYCIISMYN